MKFTVLRASDKIESQTWDSLIEALPVDRRDIHFTSAYGRVQEKLGGESILAVLHHPEGWFVAQPFIKRRVLDTPYFDLCSPYGYGGRVSDAIGFMSSITELFEEHIKKWCLDENIVTEFCYVHPWITHAGFDSRFVDLCFVKDVIVIDLKTFSEETVSRRVRRGVARARNNGATCTRLQDQEAAHMRFASLYAQSMRRKEAAQRWIFPPEYLDAHYSELSARLYYAVNDVGHTFGARILMVIGGYGTAYAHLLGSNVLLTRSGLDEFLYCSVAHALREDGYERFHLGGGLTEKADDGLLAFKAGFSPRRHKLASYSRVFNEEAYRDLSFQKIAEEVDSLGRESTSLRFPLYRRDAI